MPVTTTNAIKMNNDILINWLSNYFFEIYRLEKFAQKRVIPIAVRK
jgi:hypothetical protein